MSNSGRDGTDDELFDTAWIDAMVEDATSRIEQGRPSEATAAAVATTSAAPISTTPGDSLGEVVWVDARPAAPISQTPTAAAQPVPAQAQAAPPAARVAPADPHRVPTPPAVPLVPVKPVVATQPVAHAAPAAYQPPASTPPVPGPRLAATSTIQAPAARDTVATAPAGATTTEVEQLRWRDLDRAETGASVDARASIPPGRAVSRSTSSNLAREWLPVIVGALIVAVLLRTFVVQAFEIPSESMLPTLETDDRIVVNQLSYSFGDVQRGEVVVFERPPSMPARVGDADYLVKRVIGLPGDAVRLFEGDVWVNGERLVETGYIFDEASTRPTNVVIPGCEGGGTADSCTVPDGFVFVLGDNRTNSTDSRVAGPIDTDLLVGRAVVRAWPLNALSWL